MNKSEIRFKWKIVRGLKGAYFTEKKTSFYEEISTNTKKVLNYFLSYIKNNK